MKLGDELRGGGVTWIFNGVIMVSEGTDELSGSNDLRGGRTKQV